MKYIEEIRASKEFNNEIFNFSKDILNITDINRGLINARSSYNIKLNQNTITHIDNICNSKNILEETVFLCVMMLLIRNHSGKEEINIGIKYLDKLIPYGFDFSNDFYIKDYLLKVNELFSSLKNNSINRIFASKNHIEVENLEILNYDSIFVMDLFNEDSNLNYCDLILTNENISTNLIFNIIEDEEEFINKLYFKNDKYDIKIAELMIMHFIKIIEELDYSNKLKLNDINIITKNEEDIILNKFNNPDDFKESGDTFSSVLERFARFNPNDTALIYEDIKISYDSLNKKANSLAHILRESKIGRDDLVLLIAAKSPEMIYGMTGIIKSGAAYVPIDKNFPLERLKFITEDTNAKAVVLYKANFDQEILDEVFGDIKIIDLSDDEIFTYNTKNPKMINSPSDLLYCIYTSGSTGIPKGVLVEHHSLLTLAEYLGDYHNISKEDIVIQFANFIFDGSLWEICISLLNGAALLLPDSDTIADVRKFEQFLYKNKATIGMFPPAYFRQMKTYPLRIVATAGSPTDEAIVNSISSDKKYLNLYGPTECTVISTMWEKKENSSITIGTPVRGDNIYILKDNKLCAIDEPGELCIAGSGVSRGYLNNEELTLEKFVKNPFGKGRIYRTGDLAKWKIDGNIEYLGRIDEQVKIRGFRIEPGEIETRIREIEGINDCVVKKITDKDNESYICAYYTGSNKDLLKIKEILTQKLPEYMIPSFFMHIDQMPLTRSGKIDKNSLPNIKIDEEIYIAPRNKNEELICEIFKEILDLEKVGITDNFFNIGGHSLKMTILLNMLESKIGLRLKASQIFLNPTPKEIASLVNEKTVFEKISRAIKKEYYEMTPVLKSIYLHQKINPNDTSYNVTEAFKISKNTDEIKLKEAFNKIIARHEILRTKFTTLDGKEIMEIMDNVEIPFEYLKDSKYSEKEEISSFIKAFDLCKDTLIRVKLVEREDYKLLIIDMHHIIIDGMGLSLFMRELSDIYSGNKLKDPPQFKDYSEWFIKRDISDQENYRLEIFKEENKLLDLPLDTIRNKKINYKGKKKRIFLDESLREKINKYSNDKAITNYMIYLTALFIMLQKYSREDDICIGTPFSARVHEDTLDMLGMFVNTLAIRANPSNDKTLSEFLNEIKDIIIKAHENQEYPFERLMSKVIKSRDITTNPLFNVMLVVQNNEEIKLTLENELAKRLDHDNLTAKFDLTFEVVENKNSTEIILEYRTDIFNDESATLYLNHFINLIDVITGKENNNLHISEIEMLDELEKDKILKEFNKENNFSVINENIIDLFEKEVKKHPDSIFITYKNNSFSFDLINKKANQLARHLKTLGLTKDKFVAIISNRSPEVIIAILAVLKAGGAYVPIDSSIPSQRIEFIIEDLDPVAVLCTRMPSDIKITKPVLDMRNDEIYRANSDDLNENISANDIAYSIYTSGTTGKPKAVLIEHHSLINYIKEVHDEFFKDEKNINIPFFTNYSFDLTITSIFLAIGYGGILSIIEEERQYDTGFLKDNKFTFMKMTPSQMKMFLNTDEKLELTNLKCIFVGGEELTYDLCLQFLNKFGNHIRIINEYGPTEATVGSSIYEFDIDDKKPNLLIGKPAYNMQIYIMDHEKLQAIGAPGELCIAGNGIARSYLNRDELSDEKFIENPFGYGKMYRSGDLARFLPDGNIEFLGRIDEQIKIRGHRIEIGEIISIIRNMDQIEDVVVITGVDKKSHNELYLYYKGADIKPADIRKELSSKLPDYMIPLYIMKIDTMPLTQNGKLDKKALPEIIIENNKEILYPKTDIENILLDIFKEILDITDISTDDSFFGLGGHSLKAAELVYKIESKLDIRIPLYKVFSNPTIREISKLIDIGEDFLDKPLKKTAKKDKYLATPAQRAIYISSLHNPHSLIYNMPRKFVFKGEIKEQEIINALNKLLTKHELLRAEFFSEAGNIFYSIKDRLEISLNYIADKDLDEKREIENFLKPFDLNKSPLIRAKLIKINEHSILLLDIHHIIADGISLIKLSNDINSLFLYNEISDKNLDFSDYSERLNNKDFNKERKYRLDMFNGSLPLLELPLDFTRPKIKTFKGNTIRDEISLDIIKNISNKLDDPAITQSMIILSALIIMLSKYAREEDVIIGSGISGRNNKDTADMLGMFVNTVAIRANANKDKTIRNFIKEIKEISISAYKNQDYPLENLYDDLNLKREVSRNPLFDVMYIFQNEEDEILKIGNSSSKAEEIDCSIAKFDLTISIKKQDSKFLMELEYSKDLFLEKTAILMLNHLKDVLSSMSINIDMEIKNLEMIGNIEKLKILNEFNNTDLAYPKDKSIVELFEDVVDKSADDIAIIFEDKFLTYKELNIKSNILSKDLIDRGIKPGDFVGVLTKKSIESIIAIIAILKAGAVYLPIDDSYPSKRKNYVIKDSAMKLLINYNAEISEDIKIDVLNLKKYDYNLENDKNPSISIKSDDLAYCIYTSGTTGGAKGVLIKHHNVIKLIKNQNYIILDKNTKILQTGNIAFDASTFEIWGCLLNGGRLYIVSEDSLLDQKNLRKYILDKNINTMFVTTALFNKFLSNDETFFDGIKYLLFGGEKASYKHVNILSKRNTVKNLINVYGPTETTTFATFFKIDNSYIKERKNIPIGKPLSNTKVYVMQDEKLCAIGVVGELCITGDSVAKGYLNRPELNKDKFIKNPFGEGLMYKSGDLCRWQIDGNLEFLERIDEQVKIRGFRIELSEIEEKLKEIELIEDSTVVIREDDDGDKALYAYYVGNENLEEKIKEELKRSLPFYMIPSYIMNIKTIPFTKNGKVDKKALPVIKTRAKTEYIKPQNKEEELICEAFERELNIEKVGINDNFFEIGGHSLKAVSLSHEILLLTGVKISITDIIKEATAYNIAKILHKKLLEEEFKTHDLDKITKIDYSPIFPMSEVQKRMYILNQIDENSTNYNVSYLFKLEGNPDEKKIQQTLKKLMQVHESLRTSLLLENERYIQKVEEEIEPNFDTLTYYDKDIQEELNKLTLPFNLSKAPLFRSYMIKNIIEKDREVPENYLYLDFHHAIIDGYSMNIFIRDFIDIYNGEIKLEPSLQYRDYTNWVKSKNLDSQKKYRTHEFEGYDYEKLLFKDKKSSRSNKVKIITRELNQCDHDKLDNLVKKEGVSKNMFFLACLSALISCYYDSEDIVIGIASSGRLNKDSENILGMMVNTLPIRLKPISEIYFKDYLQTVKNTLANAIENQEYPFNKIIEDLSIKRDKGNNGLFDIFFNYFEKDSEINLNTKDFTSRAIDISSKDAKFDLVFDVISHDSKYNMEITAKDELYSDDILNMISDNFERIIKLALENDFRIDYIRQYCSLSQYEKSNIEKIDIDKNFITMFKESVRKNGDKKALILNDSYMTYDELYKKSKKLAGFIRNKIEGDENIIAVIAKPGFSMFIEAIGIMMSGNAYLPIDPSYPIEKIRYMIDQSNAKLVLMEKEHLSLELPQDVKKITKEDYINYDENIEIVIKPNQLAYVIFTSGSTGRAKGVMVEHHSLTNMIYWNNKYYDFNENDKTTKYAGFSFDASVHEMYPSLVAGCEIHIIDPNIKLDIPQITRYLNENKINKAFFPTPVCEMLLNEDLKTLEMIITGGDKLKAHSDKFIVYNNYGPTECTVLATVFPVKTYHKNIPIGKPITNNYIYILNEKMQKQMPGVRGEIYIGGEGVARGYISDTKRSRESFIKDPFKPNALIYMTGDVGRMRADGNIEYLGRNDNQLNFNGVRIEAGEIESLCLKLFNLKQCMAYVDKLGESSRLILVYQSLDEIDIDYANKILKKYLPENIIPNIWIKCEEFLLTANGKIDREKMMEIARNLSTNQKINVNKIENIIDQKSSAITKRVKDIWKEVLEVDEIAIDLNFFEAGGNSLSLIKLQRALDKNFPNTLKIADLFAHPNILEISKFIEKESNLTTDNELIDISMISKINTSKENFCGKNIFKLKKRIDVKASKNLDKLLRSSVIFALSKIALTKDISLLEIIDKNTLRKIGSSLKEINTLKDLSESIYLDDRIWNTDKLTKIDDNTYFTAGLLLSDEEKMDYNQMNQMEKLFDIMISFIYKEDSIEIILNKNRRELSDNKIREMMKLLINIVETILIKNN